MKKIVVLYFLISFLCSQLAFAIEDDVAALIKNANKVKLNNIHYDDELLNYIDKANLEKPVSNTNYDYLNFKKYKLKLKPKNYITTKNSSLKEGDKIYFIAAQDLNFKDVVIKKEDTIQARIETISQNQSFGVPAHLKVGNLRYKEMQINGEKEIVGANRMYWVYPIYYVMSAFFGTGILVAPIRGGHAKLKTNKEYLFEIN